MIRKILAMIGECARKYDFIPLMQYAFLNGIVWMLLSIIYLQYINLPDGSLYGVFYSTIFAVGHLGAFSFGFYILLQIFRFINRKFCSIMAVAVGGLLLFLLFSDVVVYVLYRFYINIPMLGLFFSPAAFELVEFPAVMILMIVVILALIYTGEFFLFKVVRKFSLPIICGSWFAVVLLSFLSFNALHAWAAFNGDGEILLRTDALPLKYAMTATRVFMRRGYKPARKITAAAGKVMKYPLNKLQFKEMPKRKNIIFVVVDSLRADMLTPEIMPYMSSLGKEAGGTFFRNHFSGGNCTKTGIFSLFYGIPGNYFDQALRSGVGAAMIDSLLELGYEVKVYSGSTLMSPPFNRTVFANVKDLELQQPGGSKIARDTVTIQKSEKFLVERKSEKPYFLFMFLDAVHGSSVPDDFEFKFPTDMRKMNFLTLGNDEKTKKDAINLMKNAALYMDETLSKFFERINIRKRLAEDTVLVFTSDHGNEASESEMKNWGHNSNFARYQTMSPLLVCGMDRPAGEVTYITSGMDVSATVLQDVLGCVNPVKDYSTGKNLYEAGGRPFAISSSYIETAIIYQGNVFAQTAYGVMQKYDINGKFINANLPAEIIREYLKILSRYSK